MVIPSTYTAALLLAIFTMLCWGSWANTMKAAGPKWRFELFYFDYAFGVMICATVIAFTFGMMGNEITFLDNIGIIRKKQIGLAVISGAVFNLANMLLVAAISVAGLAVAFPIGIGLALVIGVAWNYILRPAGNPLLLFSGAGVVALAILVASRAYRQLQEHREILALQKAAAAVAAVPKLKPPLVKASPWKGIILSLVSGVLMGSFYPIVEMARRDDIEMGSYPIGFFFAIGVLVTTFVYNIFFTNLPVEGNPISIMRYFRGTAKQHVWGLVGGIIWMAGTMANFVAAGTPPEVKVGPAVSYALGQGAALISTLWGLLVWKEFEGAPGPAVTLIRATVLLYLVGLVLISIAPLY